MKKPEANLFNQFASVIAICCTLGLIYAIYLHQAYQASPFLHFSLLFAAVGIGVFFGINHIKDHFGRLIKSYDNELADKQETIEKLKQYVTDANTAHTHLIQGLSAFPALPYSKSLKLDSDLTPWLATFLKADVIGLFHKTEDDIYNGIDFYNTTQNSHWTDIQFTASNFPTLVKALREKSIYRGSTVDSSVALFKQMPAETCIALPVSDAKKNKEYLLFIGREEKKDWIDLEENITTVLTAMTQFFNVMAERDYERKSFLLQNKQLQSLLTSHHDAVGFFSLSAPISTSSENEYIKEALTHATFSNGNQLFLSYHNLGSQTKSNFGSIFSETEIEQLLISGNLQRLNKRIISEEILYYRQSISLAKDQGNILGIWVIDTDISEEKNKELLHRSIIAYADTIFTVLDTDFAIRFENDAIQENIGGDKKERVGTSFLSHLQNHSITHFKEVFENAIKNNTPQAVVNLHFKDSDKAFDGVIHNVSQHTYPGGVLIELFHPDHRISIAEQLTANLEYRTKLFDALPSAATLITLEGEVLETNDKAKELGFFKGSSLPERIAFEDVDAISKAITKAKKKKVTNVKINLVKEDGEHVPFQVNFKAQPDGNVQTIWWDIQAQLREVEHLKKERDFSKNLVKKAKTPLMIVDNKGFIIFATDHLLEAFDYTDRELIDTRVMDLVHPEEKASLKSNILFMHSDKNAELHLDLRVKHRNGVWRNTEVFCRNVELQGGERGIVLEVHDITDDLNRKAIAEIDREFYKAMFHAMPYMVFVIDEEWNLFFMNNHVQNALGYELKGNLLDQIHSKDRELAQAIFTCREKQRSFSARLLNSEGIWELYEFKVEKSPNQDVLEGYVLSCDKLPAAEAPNLYPLAKSIFKANPHMGTILLDEKLNIESVNTQVVDGLNSTIDNLIGTNIHLLLQSDCINAFEAGLLQAKSSSTLSAFCTLTTSTGWEIEATFYYNPDLRKLLICAQDISRYSFDIQSLKQRVNFYHHAFMHSPIPLIVLDEHHCVLFASEENSTIFGGKAEGRNFLRFIDEGSIETFTHHLSSSITMPWKPFFIDNVSVSGQQNNMGMTSYSLATKEMVCIISLSETHKPIEIIDAAAIDKEITEEDKSSPENVLQLLSPEKQLQYALEAELIPLQKHALAPFRSQALHWGYQIETIDATFKSISDLIDKNLPAQELLKGIEALTLDLFDEDEFITLHQLLLSLVKSGEVLRLFREISATEIPISRDKALELFQQVARLFNVSFEWSNWGENQQLAWSELQLLLASFIALAKQGEEPCAFHLEYVSDEITLSETHNAYHLADFITPSFFLTELLNATSESLGHRINWTVYDGKGIEASLIISNEKPINQPLS